MSLKLTLANSKGPQEELQDPFHNVINLDVDR